MLVLSPGRAAADEEAPPPDTPYVFVADPAFSMEAGIRTSGSLLRLAFLYDRALSDMFELDEDTVGGRTVGIVGRLAKLVFVDLPLGHLHALFNHEVFGHGARAREAGLDPHYIFRLPPPYGWVLSSHGGHFGETRAARTGKLERDLPMTLGGIEADYWSAWWVNVAMMQRDGRVHYGQMMRYGIAKMTYFRRLAADLSTVPDDPDTHGDPDQYVTELQRRFGRWRQDDRTAIARSLRRAYLWNFADPTFWMFLYHGIVTYLGQGEREANVPSIPAGPVAFYPATRFNLSPFGAEHYLDLFARWRSVLFDLYGRGGSSGLASYWGAGIRAFGIEAPLGLSLGAELDLWAQPELLFDQRFVFDRPNRFGMGAGVHVDWRVYRGLGLIGKLAYKTRGYLMGQPLDGGAYGYVGVSIAPGAPRAGSALQTAD